METCPICKKERECDYEIVLRVKRGDTTTEVVTPCCEPCAILAVTDGLQLTKEITLELE